MTCECTTTLCQPHQDSFKDILADIPDRLATMRVSITKQSVTGGQGGRPQNDDDRPLPVNLGAADANHALRAELVTFIGRVQHCLSEQPKDKSMRGVTMWATKLMPRIAQHPESVAWYQGIARVYDRTTKAIDTPPERVRAGTCCGSTLYTVEGREAVTCKQCGTVHDIAELQAAELEKIMAYEANAAMIIKALDYAGTKIKFKTLTSWADRGHVTFTETADGRVYKVADVLEAQKTMAALTRSI